MIMSRPCSGGRPIFFAAGMAIFAFIVILAMTLIEKSASRARACNGRRDDQGGFFAAQSAPFRSMRHSKSRARRHGAIRPLRLRQDHGAPLHRRSSTGCTPGFCAIDGDIWQDESSFLPTHRRPIGYVFQESEPVPASFGAAQFALRRESAKNAAESRTPFASTRLSNCSVWRRCSIVRRAISPVASANASPSVRALLSQPRLMLMDEPLAALDRQAKDEILPFLERLHEGLSLPVIYVAHDMDEIERPGRPSRADGDGPGHGFRARSPRFRAIPILPLSKNPIGGGQSRRHRRELLTRTMASRLSPSPEDAFLFRHPA